MSMIVHRFLAWMETAPAAARAAATGALARAFLYSPMDETERSDAEAALTVLLDDPSAQVRMALAEALASAIDAPRHLVLALADGQSDIAAVVLSRSTLFEDAELIEHVATGDSLVQTAVAMRPELSAPVAAALAEVAEVDALVALARNHGARLPTFSMARIIERHGADDDLREAMIARGDLPPTVRQSIVVAMSQAMSDAARSREWMSAPRCEALARDGAERGTVSLALETGDEQLPEFIAHLRRTGQLTPALLLRSLLGGDVRLLLGALAELAGLPRGRVAGLAADPRSAGFVALYRKAGLPEGLMTPIRLALDACHALAREDAAGAPVFVTRRIAAKVIAGCKAAGEAPDGSTLMLLRRLEAEGVREEARAAARKMIEAQWGTLDLAELAPPSQVAQITYAREAELPDYDDALARVA
jgi:uncharacterized protein (DUF2336 family)